MATYSQIDDFCRERFGFSVKTCWIAHVKSDLGLPVRRAWNRAAAERQVPCPSDKRSAIVAALRYFGMIHRN